MVGRRLLAFIKLCNNFISEMMTNNASLLFRSGDDTKLRGKVRVCRATAMSCKNPDNKESFLLSKWLNPLFK